MFLLSWLQKKFVLRCSKEEDAYKDTTYWLSKLSACELPIPAVVAQGKYKDYFYLILFYIPGDDIGNVYFRLNDSEKKQIAREVVDIQRKVSKIGVAPDTGWTWNSVVEEMLDRAEERIKRKHYFSIDKINRIRILKQEMQEYLDKVWRYAYLCCHDESSAA